MHRMLSRSLGILLFALAGCATPVTHATPSGRVETTIEGVGPEQVKSALVNAMLNRGFSLSRDSAFQVAFDKPVDNVFAQVLLGSQYNVIPSARVSYTLAQIDKATRVIADLAIITNPNSPFEQRTDMNASADSNNIQDLLDTLKRRLEASPP